MRRADIFKGAARALEAGAEAGTWAWRVWWVIGAYRIAGPRSERIDPADWPDLAWMRLGKISQAGKGVLRARAASPTAS